MNMLLIVIDSCSQVMRDQVTLACLCGVMTMVPSLYLSTLGRTHQQVPTFYTKSHSGSDDANYLQRIIQQDDNYCMSFSLQIKCFQLRRH